MLETTIAVLDKILAVDGIALEGYCIWNFGSEAEGILPGGEFEKGGGAIVYRHEGVGGQEVGGGEANGDGRCGSGYLWFAAYGAEDGRGQEAAA